MSAFFTRFADFYSGVHACVRGRRRMDPPRCTSQHLLADTPEENDRLLQEILDKRRTAIITPLSAWPEGLPIPAGEEYHVLLDSAGEERCVLRMEPSHLISFRDIPASFALREGRETSLAQWQQRMRIQLQQRSIRDGRPFSLDELMVVEAFTMVYNEE